MNDDIKKIIRNKLVSYAETYSSAAIEDHIEDTLLLNERPLLIDEIFVSFIKKCILTEEDIKVINGILYKRMDKTEKEVEKRLNEY